MANELQGCRAAILLAPVGSEEAVNVVHGFFEQQKPVGVICHGQPRGSFV
jgi:hypothetical protein